MILILFNSLKTAGGNKQPKQCVQNNDGPATGATNSNLTKSTPNSTDDMNSALLKSPTESCDTSMSNGMFGKFKGFTLRPLNNSTPQTNMLHAPNVAYVQPTVQQETLTVPQRIAPAPPTLKSERSTDSSTLSRRAPLPPTHCEIKPALPPPNPGSHSRPIISKPVLESTALSMTIQPSTDCDPSPFRPAPPPPVPLHTDPKMNVKRDGTIRRIASFLKKEKEKEERPPAREKNYIEKDKLRQLEISAPIPVVTALAESSNSDSETTVTPKEEETKNLVKRTQSMRSPNKKPNIQTFGSMRQNTQSGRPKSSSVSNQGNIRPKSPPPRPPALLKKTNSTTSSGYQQPVGGIEKMYDDCEFVELSTSGIKTTDTHSSGQNDNIYSVIEEIPPAAQTLKRSELGSSNVSDMGLLSEIVSEIEKRNGDSIYSCSTLKTQLKNKDVPELKKTQSSNSTNANRVATTVASPNSSVNNYMRPAPLNTPVARVAPTRADLSPTAAFSSFKPQTTSIGENTATSLTSAISSGTPLSSAAIKVSGNAGGAATVTHKKSLTKPIVPTTVSTTKTTKTLPNSRTAPSATIQKPKPLSAKPSFSNNGRKTLGTTMAVGMGTPRAAPIVKAGNIAALTQRYEKKDVATNISNTINKGAKQMDEN